MYRIGLDWDGIVSAVRCGVNVNVNVNDKAKRDPLVEGKNEEGKEGKKGRKEG